MPSVRNNIACQLLGLVIGLTAAAALSPVFAEQLSTQALAKKPAKELFGRQTTAAPMKPRAIGFYAKGCLAGGVQLPATGSAWQAMRLSRNRNWGHPELVELIKRLAIEAQAQDGWPGLLVGDLSQPRGGPMLTGHASHQDGLDADVWLNPMPDRKLTYKERENISAISVIKDRKRINSKIWTEAHARLIRRAASYPQVARIFVHPPIKKALCDWAPKGSDLSWLKKVRAYYGHHYHFHIRIKCPKGVGGCRNQAPPAPKDGTGCGAELAYWFSDKPWHKHKPSKKPKTKVLKPKPKPPMKLSALPKACRTVLTAQ